MKKLILNYPGAATWLWALVIFGLCATPGRYIPSASWLDLLSFDKFVHAGIFFVLCALALFTSIKRNQPAGFLYGYVLLAIAYGASLEFMQANYFIERSADWQDIAANSTGCLTALLMRKKLNAFYLRHSTK